MESDFTQRQTIILHVQMNIVSTIVLSLSSKLHPQCHVTPNAQPHQDKELVKVMENVYVGGDGLGLMQNTSYPELLRTELWLIIVQKHVITLMTI